MSCLHFRMPRHLEMQVKLVRSIKTGVFQVSLCSGSETDGNRMPITEAWKADIDV